MCATVNITVTIIRTIPIMVLIPKCSSRKIAPRTTAVSGCRAPSIDVKVGPMRLTALTPVKFETIVDHKPSPAM